MNQMRAAGVALGLVAASAIAAEPQTRLGYQAEQAIQDMKYYIDRTEAASKDLAERVAKMNVGDAGVQIQQVTNLLGTKLQTDQYLTNVNDRLKGMPAEHPKVKAQADRIAPIEASLAASHKKLGEIKASLDKVVAVGQGDAYQADFKRLEEISQTFPSGAWDNQWERVIEPAKDRAAVKAERERMGQTYSGLLQQSTAEAQQLKGRMAHFDEQFAQFNSAADQYAATAPAAIGQALDELTKEAEQAAAERKHLWLRADGGIPQRLKQVEGRYDLLAVVAPHASGTRDAKARLDSTRAKIEQIRGTLSADIVASNECPVEAYNGSDHDALVALVKKKWGESGIRGQVLKAGINSTAWTRSTRWSRSNDTWYRSDISRAQGFVVVKASDALATVYYVNLGKDHMAGDTVTASFFDDPKAEPGITQKVPLAKVK